MIREVPPGWTGEERRRRPRAPYPEADESDAVLKDGRAVHLRPIRWGDAPQLLQLYTRLSNESLYFRFFAVPQPDPSKAEYLAHVDYQNQYALVAEDESGVVAVARFHRDAGQPDRAEVAFTVADDMQGKGLGGILFARLASLALARGVKVFDAEVLKENEKMIRIFASAGLNTTVSSDGDRLHYAITLQPAAPAAPLREGAPRGPLPPEVPLPPAPAGGKTAQRRRRRRPRVARRRRATPRRPKRR